MKRLQAPKKRKKSTKVKVTDAQALASSAAINDAIQKNVRREVSGKRRSDRADAVAYRREGR